MTVDCVRAEYEPLGDVRVAHSLSHEAEHLALTFAQLTDPFRRSFPGRLWQPQESGHGSHRIGYVAVPRKVRVPRNGGEVGSCDEAGDLLAGPNGDRPIMVAMDDERWDAHCGERVADVVFEDEAQQLGRSIRRRGRALVSGHGAALRRRGVRIEDVDEHLAAEPPRRAHELHHRRAAIRMPRARPLAYAPYRTTRSTSDGCRTA